MSKHTIQNPKLTAKNPHFGNRYAPLDEVLRVILEVIPSERISQTTKPVAGVPYFFTRLLSEEGEVIKTVAFPFAVGKGDPQSLGSALTYARRYGLLLLFNLVGEEDDDAEASMDRKPKAKAATKKSTPKATPKAPTKTQTAMADNAVVTADGDDW